MGIHDRDYYRNDKRSVLDPFTARTKVTIALVIINAVIFVFQVATRQVNEFGFAGLGWFTDGLKLDVNRVQQGEVWRLFTGAFLHDPFDWTHVVFNMLFLWWAGSSIEDIYGSREFLAFYLTSVIVTGLAYFGFEMAAGTRHSAIGASGAVTAVLLVFACHYPHRTVHLFFILPVPVWALVVFQILNDTLGLVGVNKRPIAYVAHLSGAAFGFLYHHFQWRILNWLPSFGKRDRSRPARPGKKLKVFQPEPEPEPEPAAASTGAGNAVSAPSPVPLTGKLLDEHLEAKLDEVLEKVQRHGKDSLNETEREILQRASEIFRKKRQG